MIFGKVRKRVLPPHQVMPFPPSYREEEVARLRDQWLRWYAWHPCRLIDGRWVCCEEVERKWGHVGYRPASVFTEEEIPVYGYAYREIIE